jgi:hypothetical protein
MIEGLLLQLRRLSRLHVSGRMLPLFEEMLDRVEVESKVSSDSIVELNAAANVVLAGPPQQIAFLQRRGVHWKHEVRTCAGKEALVAAVLRKAISENVHRSEVYKPKEYHANVKAAA